MTPAACIVAANRPRCRFGCGLRRGASTATTLLVLPALLAILGALHLPFVYGLGVRSPPRPATVLRNYRRFFADPFLHETICNTLALAVPTTLLNLLSPCRSPSGCG